MHVANAVTRTLDLPAPPTAVALYFSRNERLLARLVGPGNLERLTDGGYRLGLGPFALPGLTVRPLLDVYFQDSAHRTTLSARGSRLLEGPPGMALDILLTGHAAFEPGPQGCRLECRAEATVSAGLPFPLSLLPRRGLEAAARAALNATMEALATRFEALLRQDFDRSEIRAA